MIDTKVFNELMNRGVITQVGLDASKYVDLADLQNCGLATGVGAKEDYDEIVAELINTDEIKAAFLAEVAKGGTVSLPMDLVFDAPITIEKNVTINLNGYSITTNQWTENDGSTNSYAFWVKKGTLTLEGEGSVIANESSYSMAVWANGGNAVINGGKYYNNGDACDLIYLSGKSNVTINGGEFVATLKGEGQGTNNKRSAINIKDANRATCKVEVKGGKFFEFNPADNVSETEHTNFVAAGYKVIASTDGWFTVEKSEVEIVNPVE